MTYDIFSLYILVICFLCNFRLYFTNEKLELSIEEETPVNSVLIDLLQKFSNDYASFYLDDYFFSVTHDGKLKVKSNIDIDTMCINHQKCCGEEQCIVSLTIFYKIKHNNVDKFMKIMITIKDINDNVPHFVSLLQKLSVSEFAGIGKLISLQPAQDLDFDKKNQIRNYSFFEATRTFDLDQTRIGSPALVIINNLDYETKKEYTAVWAACDFQSRCAKQKILIDVVDENDNTPKFQEHKLSLRIKEDLFVGKIIVQLNATDKDSTPYNLVKYGFWEASSDRNIKHTFMITENTGELRLKEKLNTRIRTFYKFKIFAEDAKASNMEKDYVEIEIHVDDVNDHEPIIDIVNTKLPIYIKENTKPTYILSVKVSDNDFGVNGNVSCGIDNYSQDFLLEQSNEQLYSVKSRRAFDYENEKVIGFSITCFDSGLPPKSAQKSIEIKIIDENEFLPLFSQSTYHQEISENKLEGQFVLKVYANDRDAGASLNYSLEGNVEGFFTIEALSGEIRTGPKMIDREENEKIQFTVNVYDSKIKPNTGKATVIVVINDENDNAPQFTSHFLKPRFSLIENSPIMTKIEQQIEATDKDKSELNSKIKFVIYKTFNFNLHEMSDNYFAISNSGIMTNTKVIDREVNPNFTLTIKVYDHGSPSLSSSMNITLYIEDRNDNSPIFMVSMFDSESRIMVNISSERNIESVITTLKALDYDSGENGQVYYSINGKVEDILQINSSSGEIKLARKIFHGSYNFIVRAHDNGLPQRVTKINLILNVYGDDMNLLNSTIIVLLLTITGIISLFLIIAITCVRRRPRNIPSFTQSESDIQKNMQNGSPVKYDQKRHNDSIYYPSNFDMLTMSKSGNNIPMDSFEKDNVITSNLLPYNPNRYSEFTMAPSYLSSCINIGRITPTFRSNDHDDESADSGKGGSEDDAALANLQMTQYGIEHLDLNNKGPGCSSSSPNTRVLNMHRYNYRSRNPSTFHVVPEDELVQNLYPNKSGHIQTGSLKSNLNHSGQGYSCVNVGMNTYTPLMHSSYATSSFNDPQTSTMQPSCMKFRDPINYPVSSSIHMCIDK